MGRIERQKRELIIESNKRLLGEASYSGIIKKGDDICEIICKRKIAKQGSSGDVVKMIQHLLDSNGFNKEFKGGGMKSGCSKEYPSCDGIFKNHTRDAVKEFQRRYKLTVDGVVGYNTWKAMCDNLEFTESLPKKEFCKDCQCNEQDQPIGGDEKDTPSPTDDFRENELEIIDCDDLKYCVGKHLYQQVVPDIVGFYRCVSEKVDLPDIPNPKKGCISDDGRNLCDIIPKGTPFGVSTISVMGYYYDPSKGKCVSVGGGSAPFRQMEKCTECCERRK